MNKNAFIIAEYNPLHNGHKYHIDETRRAGAKTIIVLMSGSFVQRGECALFPKTERAKAAIEAGADLVLEIPVKYVINGSLYFSRGAVLTALSTEQNGTISFGSESDLSLLTKNAEFLCLNETKCEIEELCGKTGFSFPRAQQAVVEKTLGTRFGKAMTMPNNILAIHYITEAMRLSAPFDFFAVERIGSSHDSLSECGMFSSAMKLRSEIMSNNSGYGGFMPDFAEKIFSDCISNGKMISSEKFETASLSRLKQIKKDDFKAVNGVNQGLENLFYDAVRKGYSLDSICQCVKSKRFTYSRLRQICLSSVLGITRDDLDNGISYINVLGFNDTGKTFLRNAINSSDTLFAGNLSTAKVLRSEIAVRDIETEEQSEMFYNLCLAEPDPYFSPYKRKPFYRKKI